MSSQDSINHALIVSGVAYLRIGDLSGNSGVEMPDVWFQFVGFGTNKLVFTASFPIKIHLS